MITSVDNVRLAACRRLADKKFCKKYRQQTGDFLVEGERLVADAFRYGADVKEIFVKESVSDKFCTTYPQAEIVADKAFATISDTVNSQGIIAVCHHDKPGTQRLRLSGHCLVLDGLQDPGNVGTLLRTAAATGFDNVVSARSVDLYSPKVMRSAMGAHFCLNLYEVSDIEQAFELVGNCQKVCADMGGKNVFETEFDCKDIALVVGNEGNGLSQFSRQHTDKTVCLPMTNKFESLNAAVAGSVIMYQIFAYVCKN